MFWSAFQQFVSTSWSLLLLLAPAALQSMIDRYEVIGARERCPNAQCQYDLSGLPTSGTCPECGLAYEPGVVESYRLQWRPRRPVIALAWMLIVMVAVYYGTILGLALRFNTVAPWSTAVAEAHIYGPATGLMADRFAFAGLLTVVGLVVGKYMHPGPRWVLMLLVPLGLGALMLVGAWSEYRSVRNGGSGRAMFGPANGVGLLCAGAWLAALVLSIVRPPRIRL